MGQLKKVKLLRRQNGVSLLELLVVLVLISVLLGTVSLNYFTSPSEQVETTANHLRKQLSALRDAAVLQGRLHSIIFSKNEYSFMVLNKKNKLVKVENDSALKSEILPEGIAFTEFDFGNENVNENPILFVDSSGLLPPFRLAIASNNETWWLSHKSEEGLRVVQKK